MTTTPTARRVLALLIGLGVSLSVLVVPAAADDVVLGTAAFRGRIKIGDAFTPKAQKDAKSTCDGTSGLHFPGVANGKEVCWRLAAPDPVDPHKPAAAAAFCQMVGVPGPAGTCSIRAAGQLGAVVAGNPATGGFCGQSRGFSGNGWITIGQQRLKLTDLSWPAEVAGRWPVIGRWHSEDKTKTGTLSGMLSVSGNTNDGTSFAIACLVPNGATSFDVNGFLALTMP